MSLSPPLGWLLARRENLLGRPRGNVIGKLLETSLVIRLEGPSVSSAARLKAHLRVPGTR